MPTKQEGLEKLLDEYSRILTNDPGALEPTDPLYVKNLHGTGGEDVVLSMARACERVEGSALFYFTGQRGTGKSTELKRLAAHLSGRKTQSFLIDALEYIGDSHPIELIDLLLVMAIAFADKLREDYQKKFLDESISTRIGKWLQTEVTLEEFSALGAKVTFREKRQSLIQRIREFDLTRSESFIKEARELITEMAQFVRRQSGCDRVVLIVDSLERLRGVGTQAGTMFDNVVRVFDGGIDALRINQLQVIYSVPPYLPFLTNVKNLVRVFSLASVRVYEPPKIAKRRPRESGIASMRDIVKKRCPHWQELLNEDALDKLIAASGGDVRQLLRRFLVDVFDQAYFALGELPLGLQSDILKNILDRHRVDFEQMVVRDEYPLLKLIADQNAVEIQSRNDLPTVARFFDIRAVLGYRNGVDWIDLNPLLWDLIDQYAARPDKP